MKPSILGTVCILLSLAAPAVADTFGEVTVRSGDRLEVELETGASVEVTVWNRDSVSVEAKFPDADAIRFEVSDTSYGARVTSEFRHGRNRRGSGGEVTIQVPRYIDIELDTTGGDIRVRGVGGSLSGQTMGGDLVLAELTGRVSLKTMGGNIEMTDSDVRGTLETMGGNVTLRDVVGSVDASSMGGNVIFDNVTPHPGGSADGGVRVSTMGGNIEVPHAPYGADVETMGGNVEIGAADGFVKANTMGGDIRVESLDGWIRAGTLGGAIEVTMVGDPSQGRRDVRLSSEGGDITLYVPADLAMDVDVTLAYTKNSKRRFKVESDFDLEIREPDTWDYSEDPPRRYIYASGTTGSADHKVKLETTNGNIRLLKR
jgi:hypothetical protein